MTTREYMILNPTINLSWCRPLQLSRGTRSLTIALNEGNIVGLRIGEQDITTIKPLDTITNYLEIEAAQTIADVVYNRDRDVMIRELGCARCPWFLSCEAMDEA